MVSFTLRLVLELFGDFFLSASVRRRPSRWLCVWPWLLHKSDTHQLRKCGRFLPSTTTAQCKSSIKIGQLTNRKNNRQGHSVGFSKNHICFSSSAQARFIPIGPASHRGTQRIVFSAWCEHFAKQGMCQGLCILALRTSTSFGHIELIGPLIDNMVASSCVSAVFCVAHKPYEVTLLRWATFLFLCQFCGVFLGAHVVAKSRMLLFTSSFSCARGPFAKVR